MHDPLRAVLFDSNPDSVAEDGDLVVHMPAGLTTKKQVLAELFRQLKFPDDLGDDWDAAEEGLSDLSWIEDCERIIVRHEDLPLAGDVRGRFDYLSLLADTSHWWEELDEIRFDFVFPESLRALIKTASRPSGVRWRNEST